MSDPRSIRSRDALITAMTAVLDDPAAEIPTITELCTAAGVSRPTFYQHFGDVPSVVSDAALARIESLFDEVAPVLATGQWQSILHEVVGSLLDGLVERRTFFRRVLTGSSAHASQEKVVDYLVGRLLTNSPLADSSADSPAADDDARGVDGDHRARQTAAFLAAGTTWLLTRWLLDDSPAASSAEMTSRVSSLLVAGVLARP